MTQQTAYRQPSRQEWQQLIERQAASGHNQASFCAAHGVAKSTFQYWKRRLGQSSSADPSQSELDSMFMPLLGSAADQTAAPDPGGWDIELDLGGGICLRIRRRS